MSNKLVVHIDKMVNGGLGLAQLGTGIKVFVPYGVKEDVLEIRIVEKKRDYWRGEIVKVLNPSPYRTKPRCKYFYRCGGCQWQMVDYKFQPTLKREVLLDSIEHIAGMRGVPVLETIPSPKAFNYRNKVHFPIKRVSPSQVIMGFYKQDTHYIIDVERCPLHLSQFNEIFGRAKEFLGKENLSIYDERTHDGVIRNFTMRGSERMGETLLVIVTTKEYLHKKTASRLMGLSPNIVGVVENINPERGNAIFGEKSILRAGVDYFHEKVSNYTFVVSGTAFFQVNTDVAEKMVEFLENLLREIGEVDTIVDGYSGVGLFSIPSAKYARRVLAIEISPVASKDAVRNVKLNSATNVEVIVADANEVMENLPKAEVVILDPPRKGLSQSVLNYLSDKKPYHVLYFSCNPATLARDLKNILEVGYDVEFVQPFDMFPQTFHVESLTYLKRKSI